MVVLRVAIPLYVYTEAGFNDYFINFPSSVRVILIALQSVHVILALPNALVTFQLPCSDRCSIMMICLFPNGG